MSRLVALLGSLCLAVALLNGLAEPAIARDGTGSEVLSPERGARLPLDDEPRTVRFRLVDEPAETYSVFVWWGDDTIARVDVPHPGGTATYTREVDELAGTGRYVMYVYGRTDGELRTVASTWREVVEAPDPYVASITATPRTFDPDAARPAQRATTLRVRAFEAETVRLVVRRGADGTVVRRLARPVRREVTTFRWDGRDKDGARQRGGTYVVRAVATSEYGTTADRRTTVRVLPR